eukprot:gi/632942427/ref/XP_007886407.1/ PREDICTED: protein AHNAK2 isoform X2 [Callorhinchus milii]
METDMEVILKTEAEVGAGGFSVKGGENKGIFIKNVQKESPAAKLLSMREGDQLISATVYFDNMKFEDALKILQYSEPYKIQYCLKRKIPSAAAAAIGPEQVDIKEFKSIVGEKEDIFTDLYQKKTKLVDSEEMKIHRETQRQEMGNKGTTKTAKVSDITFSGSTFPDSRKTKMDKLDRSHSLPEAEEYDQRVITATSTDIESCLKLPESPQKVKKRRKKIKFPHLGPSTKAEVPEDTQMVSTDSTEFSTAKQGSAKIIVDVTLQNTKDDKIMTGVKPTEQKPKDEKQETNLDLETKYKMPKLKIAKFLLSETISPKDDITITLPQETTSHSLSPQDQESETIQISQPKAEGDKRQNVSLKASEQLKARPYVSTVQTTIPSEHKDKAGSSILGYTVQMEHQSTNMPTNVILQSFQGNETDIIMKQPDINIPLKSTETEIKGSQVHIQVSPSKGAVGTIQDVRKKPKLKTVKKIKKTAPDEMAQNVDISYPPDDASKVDTETVMLTGEFSAGVVQVQNPDAFLKIAKVKVPSLDVTLPQIRHENLSPTKSQIEVTLPAASMQIKGPETEIHPPTMEVGIGSTKNIAGADGKFKMPKVKIPHFGLSMPKFKGTEEDVGSKKADSETTITKSKLGMKGPEMDTEIPSFEIDMEISEAKIGGKKGKYKLPHNKGPKIGFSASPKLKLEDNVPKGDVDASKKLKGEIDVDVSLSKPKVDVTLPDVSADIKVPDAEINIPTKEINIEGPDGKFNMPTVKMPYFGISMPKFKGPEVDIGLKKTDIDIQLPKAEGHIKGPEIDIHAPTVDLDTGSAEMNIEGPDGKFKMPKVKKPDFGMSMPKFKGPEVDLSLKKPDIDFTLPKAKADIKEPEIDVQISSCEVDVEVPDVDVGGGKGKFKMPHMKMPKFGFSAPEIKAPKLDLDMSLPKVKGEIDADVSLSKPKVDVTVPDVSAHIKGPKADINIPTMDVEAGSSEINIEGPDGKFKLPTVKMPHFGISKPKFKGPEVDLSLKKPDIDLTLPKAKADIKGPEIDVQVPLCEAKVEVPDVDIGGGKGKFKMPHMKMPKFGISAPDIKAPKLDLDVSLPKVKGEIDADVSLRKPKVDVTVPDVSADIKGPKADINIPTMDVEAGSAEINIEGPDGKFKLPTVKMPHFGISKPKCKGPDVDLSLKKPDIDLKLPKAKADIKGTEIDVQVPLCEANVEAPDVDIGGRKGKFKMPHMKMPKFGISAPDLEAPKWDLDVSLPKGDVEVSLPTVKGEIDTDVNLSKPKVDVTLPDVSVDIKAPKADVQIPTMELEAGSAEINIEGPDGKFKLPTVKMPHFGFSMTKFKGPEVDLSLKKPDIDLALPETKADIKGPEINVQLPSCAVGVEAPDVDIGGGKGKFKMPHMKMPKFGISAPDIKAPKLDLDVSLPKVKGEIDADVSLRKPKVDVTVPDVSADIKGPKADINIPTMDVEAGSAEINIEGPDGKFKLPTVKMPHFGMSMPKFKGPEVDLSLKKPDIDLALPKAKADIKGPAIDVQLPSCAVSVEAPDVDIGGGKGKFKMPHMKMPKFGISAPDIKAPKLDLDVSLPKVKGEIDADVSLRKPKVDVTVPDVSVDIKGPKADINIPMLDVEAGSAEINIEGPDGNFKMPTVKMPHFGMSMPKFRGPKVDLSLKKPDIDLTLPTGKADLKGPEIHVQLPSCEVDVEAPDINTGGKKGKFKMPHMKMPKFGISAPDIKAPKLDLDVNLPKVKGEIVADVNLSKPKVDLAVPDVSAHIKGPKADINVPTMDVETGSAEMNIEGPDGKFNMPTVKMPHFEISMPKFKGTDVDIGLKKPDIDVNLPKAEGHIKGPEIDIHTPTVELDTGSAELNFEGPDGKLKMPKVKKPYFGFSMPKFKSPEVDLSLKKPDIDLALPKGKAGMKGPEVDVQLPSCEVDVEAPDVDVGGTKGKFKMPHMKMPKFGISGPDIKAPKLDLDVSLPKVKGEIDGDVTFHQPKVDITVPDVSADIKGTKADISIPTMDVEAGSAEINIEDPDGKFKLPTVKIPHFGISMTKFKGPEVDLNLKKPDIDVKMPKAERHIKGPEIEVDLPSCEIDVEASDLDTGGAKGKFKMPHMKMPKFGMSGPDIKAPKLDLDVSLQKGDLDVSLPKVKGEIDADITLHKPKVDVAVSDVSADIKGPKADINIPMVDVEPGSAEINIEGPDGKFKLPTVKVPHFGISLPKFKGPEVDLSLKKPDIDVKLPTTEGDIKGPEIDIHAPTMDLDTGSAELNIEGPDGKFKMPKIKKPHFTFSMPKFKGPELDISRKNSDIDITLSKPKVAIKGPGIDVDASSFEADVENLDVEIGKAKGKFKMPHIKGSKFGFSALDIKAPKFDLEFSLAKADIDVSAPNADIKPGKLDGNFGIEHLSFEGPDSSLKMPKVEVPSLDVSLPKVKGEIDAAVSLSKPQVDVTLPDVSADIKGPVANINIPTMEVEVGSAEMNIEGTDGKVKMPKAKKPHFRFLMPKFKGPEMDIGRKKPDIDITLSKPKADIKGPEIDIEVPSCEVHAEAPDVDIGGTKGKFKMLQMKMPKFGISAPDVKAPKLDLDVSLPKMEGEIDANVSLSKSKVDVTVPDVSTDIKGPTMDVETGSAEINIEGPGGKFKLPTVKMQQFGISTPKFKGPEVDIGMQKTDIDPTLPKAETVVKIPEIDLHAPTVGMVAGSADINIDGKNVGIRKIKVAQLEILDPSVSASLKGTEKDISIGKCVVDVKGLGKGSKLSGKLNNEETEFNVGIPDSEITGGKISLGDIDGNLFGTKLKGSALDCDVQVDIKSSEPDLGLSVLDTNAGSKIEAKQSTYGVSLLKVSSPTAQCESGIDGAGSILTSVNIIQPKLKQVTDTSTSGPTFGGVFEGHGDDTDIKTKAVPGKVKFKLPRIGLSEAESTQSVPELKGQKDSDVVPLKTTEATKTKTSWFKFPKISFSSPWRKEKQETEVGKNAAPEIPVSSTPSIELGVKATSLKADDSSAKASPLKQTIDEGSANIALRVDKTETVTKYETPSVTAPETDVKKPNEVVTSTARTELALLESSGFSLNVGSAEAEQSYKVSSSESSSEHHSYAIGIPTIKSSEQSKEKAGALEVPDLSMSQPEGSSYLSSAEHSKVAIKGYLIQATGGTSEPPTSPTEHSSFLSEFRIPKRRYVVPAGGHGFTKEDTKTEGSVVVLTESSTVQHGDITSEATASAESSTAFQNIREIIQGEQKQFYETSQHSSVSISVTESEIKTVKKTVTKK